jgi:hypothetical protein
MQVLKSAIIAPNDREEFFMQRLLHDEEEVPNNEFMEQLDKFKAVQANIKRDRASVSLFPPGKIVHFVKTEEMATGKLGGKLCCSRMKSYTPYYAANNEFTEIVISPSMGLDHFPDRVCLSIEGVARDWGIDVRAGSINAPMLSERMSGEGGSDGTFGNII